MKESMENEFYPIPGYEGFYEINREGVVRSVDRIVLGGRGEYNRIAKGSVKKNTLRKNGYYAIGLWKNNVQKIENIHRILATIFIPNPNNLPGVNHIDGDKANNKLSNLEWCNQSYNVQHAYNTGLTSRNKKIVCVETGRIFNSASEAARFVKGYQSAISACARGERKKAYGYHWSFLNELEELHKRESGGTE